MISLSALIKVTRSATSFLVHLKLSTPEFLLTRRAFSLNPHTVCGIIVPWPFFFHACAPVIFKVDVAKAPGVVETNHRTEAMSHDEEHDQFCLLSWPFIYCNVSLSCICNTKMLKLLLINAFMLSQILLSF